MLAPWSSRGAAAPSFSGLVVFGDSLSDTGNAGRFSNGPVWVEHLAERLGTTARPSEDGGSNFAVGGARLHDGGSSLPAQVEAYRRALPAGRADPQALHVVYGGGNDLRAAYGAADGEGVVRAATAALGRILDALAAAGARHILVPNLPDLAMTPEARSLDAERRRAVTALSLAFNAAAAAVLRAAEARHGFEIRRLDVFALAERALADPAAFGFRNTTEPCGGGDCEGYLFWDSVHPTTAAHARLAEAALQTLTPV